MKYCIFSSPYSFQYKNIANNFWLNYQRIEVWLYDVKFETDT